MYGLHIALLKVFYLIKFCLLHYSKKTEIISICVTAKKFAKIRHWHSSIECKVLILKSVWVSLSVHRIFANCATSQVYSTDANNSSRVSRLKQILFGLYEYFKTCLATTAKFKQTQTKVFLTKDLAKWLMRKDAKLWVIMQNLLFVRKDCFPLKFVYFLS